jgi:hypothetical protein
MTAIDMSVPLNGPLSSTFAKSEETGVLQCCPQDYAVSVHLLSVLCLCVFAHWDPVALCFSPSPLFGPGTPVAYEKTDEHSLPEQLMRGLPNCSSTAALFLAPEESVLDSMLSEHQCMGWLEGYLLTGRHGLFNPYEAFVRIVDSMFTQHAKWLKTCSEVPWRRKIASLNYLLTSHVWRQDHDGFTHQDPGFIDHVINKKSEIVRVYLPPDANGLLSVMDHRLRSQNYVNVVVCGKHDSPISGHGCRRRALHRGDRNLAMGQQRSGQ